MAILQSALVEPLLSRQQSAVIRNIACAAQMNEALKSLKLIEGELSTDQLAMPTAEPIAHIRNYLKAEITRVLMQIKIPAKAVLDSKADTQAPGKVPGVNLRNS